MNRIYKNSPTYSLFLIMLIAFIFVLLMTQEQSLLAGEWQKKYNYRQLRHYFEQPPLWDAPLNPSLTASHHLKKSVGLQFTITIVTPLNFSE